MQTKVDGDVLSVDGVPVDVRLKVSPRARRFTLRLPPQEDFAVLTLPPGVPLTETRQFLLRNSDWLAGALSKRPQLIAVQPGALIPIEGELLEITLDPSVGRLPQITQGRLLIRDGTNAGTRIKALLKNRARAALVPAAHQYAEQVARQVRRVSLRDTRSRWGSCSANGTLSFSWRLAMAPREVLDYVAAHEAAHLVEMNHGPRFWNLVARLMPDYEHHRAWLRHEGRSMHSYRFE